MNDLINQIAMKIGELTLKLKVKSPALYFTLVGLIIALMGYLKDVDVAVIPDSIEDMLIAVLVALIAFINQDTKVAEEEIEKRIQSKREKLILLRSKSLKSHKAVNGTVTDNEDDSVFTADVENPNKTEGSIELTFDYTDNEFSTALEGLTEEDVNELYTDWTGLPAQSTTKKWLWLGYAGLIALVSAFIYVFLNLSKVF